jgi:hypothetical protein
MMLYTHTARKLLVLRTYLKIPQSTRVLAGVDPTQIPRALKPGALQAQGKYSATLASCV